MVSFPPQASSEPCKFKFICIISIRNYWSLAHFHTVCQNAIFSWRFQIESLCPWAEKYPFLINVFHITGYECPVHLGLKNTTCFGTKKYCHEELDCEHQLTNLSRGRNNRIQQGLPWASSRLNNPSYSSHLNYCNICLYFLSSIGRSVFFLMQFLIVNF